MIVGCGNFTIQHLNKNCYFFEKSGGFTYLKLAVAPATWYINAVFHKAGKRLHTEAFRKEIYKICDLLEITRRSPHKIRKTYASILMDAKADSLTVTNLMGHTEIRTTENFYHRNRKTMGKKQELVDSIPEFQVAK